MRFLTTVTMCCVVADLLTAPVAQAAPVSGRCQINEAVYRADLFGDFEYEAGTFADIPGVEVSFVQGGTAPGCVVVTFSAESFAEITNPTFAMFIRPLLDTSTRSVPADFQFAANDPNLFTTRTATFIFRSVSPGSHTVRMQFKGAAGKRVEIGTYTLVVQHFR